MRGDLRGASGEGVKSTSVGHGSLISIWGTVVGEIESVCSAMLCFVLLAWTDGRSLRSGDWISCDEIEGTGW